MSDCPVSASASETMACLGPAAVVCSSDMVTNKHADVCSVDSTQDTDMSLCLSLAQFERLHRYGERGSDYGSSDVFCSTMIACLRLMPSYTQPEKAIIFRFLQYWQATCRIDWDIACKGDRKAEHKRKKQQRGTGSLVLLDGNTYIMTTWSVIPSPYHVVSYGIQACFDHDGTRVYLELDSKRMFTGGGDEFGNNWTLIGVSKQADLLMLRDLMIVPIPLDGMRHPAVDEWLYISGFPNLSCLARDPSLTHHYKRLVGMIDGDVGQLCYCGQVRVIGGTHATSFLHGVNTFPGNAGSLVLSRTGQLIGLHVDVDYGAEWFASSTPRSLDVEVSSAHHITAHSAFGTQVCSAPDFSASCLSSSRTRSAAVVAMGGTRVLGRALLLSQVCDAARKAIFSSSSASSSSSTSTVSSYSSSFVALSASATASTFNPISVSACTYASASFCSAVALVPSPSVSSWVSFLSSLCLCLFIMSNLGCLCIVGLEGL